MARPRKPTAVLELNGAFKKDPARGRARKNEPKPQGSIGDPPAYFDDDHAAIWYEYIGEAAPGVLTVSDRKLLEMACRITRKMRVIPGSMTRWLTFLGDALTALGMPEEDVQDMKKAFRTAVGLSAQELSLLATLLTRMGFTPADRSRINAGKPGEEEAAASDPLAAFAAGRTVTAKPN